MSQLSECIPSDTAVADASHDICIQVIGGRSIAALSAFKGQCQALADRIFLLFGVTLPRGAYCSVSGSMVAICHAPQTWLLVDEQRGSALAPLLTSALQGVAAVCDQSDAYQIVRLQGGNVRKVLAKMFHVDLHPAAFGEGVAAVTRAGHFSVTLCRLADQRNGDACFETMVSRSMSESFQGWLADSTASLDRATEKAHSQSPLW
jgi:heterotetrameric sarcosine oxidase gamma subunit